MSKKACALPFQPSADNHKYFLLLFGEITHLPENLQNNKNAV